MTSGQSPDTPHRLELIDDVMAAIDRIRTYVARSPDLADEAIYDAVCMRLQVIGELINKLPEDLLKSEPGIPWKRIVGLRHIISHAYNSLDPKRIRGITAENLDDLEAALIRIRRSQTAGSSAP